MAGGWSIPREWDGETAVIYGGGPSLNQADVDYARTRFRRIACNDAFLLDPDCEVLCWCDCRWYLWNKNEIKRHCGKYRIAWKHVPQIAGAREIHFLQQLDSQKSLLKDPRYIIANNTGLGALQIAYHFGAKRILLLGFDMRRVNKQMNWHQRHQKSVPPGALDLFRTRIENMAPALDRRGVEVINCTKDSALRCFPYRDIREIT
jgi:hypothetical protein